jgi:hypothetical protein
MNPRRRSCNINQTKEEIMDKIAFCGHHCGFCPFDQCPGCRSENAFCSFPTLFADKTCPKVKCCLAKGLDGCYECQEVLNCRIGFYDTKEQVAKATALFIQKHGKQQYEGSLVRAIQSGIRYPHQFNELEDVRKMIELLEQYRLQGNKSCVP